MRHLMIAACLGMAAAAPAAAAPVVYTLTGTLTGTLTPAIGPAVTYTNDPFVWTVVGNTTQKTTIVGPPPAPAVPAIADVINVGGQTLSPTIATYFGWSPVFIPTMPPIMFGVGGFADATTSEGISWMAGALFTYDGVTSLAPLPVLAAPAGPLPTDGGVLNITGASGLIFSAEVDEPAGLAVLAVPALLLAIRRRVQA